jgi:hypothetical protein
VLVTHKVMAVADFRFGRAGLIFRSQLQQSLRGVLVQRGARQSAVSFRLLSEVLCPLINQGTRRPSYTNRFCHLSEMPRTTSHESCSYSSWFTRDR